MKPTQVIESIKTCIKANQPPFIHGSPGIGKSDVVRQVGKDLDLPIADVRAVLLDPVDLRGLPTVNGDGRAKWAIPEFLPREGKGILFLDELNAAPKLVQAACYQLVLDRKLGEYTLPKEWHIVSAGNRETDRAVVTRMPSALANRFIHIDFDVDVEDWILWALNHNVMTELISFIRFRPPLLNAFDPKAASKAFPTPRSWMFVNNIMATNPAQDILYDLLKGTVGEGATAEFLAFWKIFNKLPSPDVILTNPDSSEVPTDPATLYALMGALAARAKDSNMDRLMKYMARVPNEFCVLLMRDALRRDNSLANTRAYINWNSQNSDIV